MATEQIQLATHTGGDLAKRPLVCPHALTYPQAGGPHGSHEPREHLHRPYAPVTGQRVNVHGVITPRSLRPQRISGARARAYFSARERG